MPAEGERLPADHLHPSGSPACPCCLPQLQLATRRIGRELSRRGFIAGMMGR